MSVFCYKNLDTARHLGAELKEAREKKEFSLDEVERLSFIPLKYLQALETGEFLLLPKGRAHLNAYLRKLCGIYDLNFEHIIYKFHCEDGFKKTAHHQPKKKSRHLNHNFLWARNLSLASFILFFVGYLGFQIYGITTAPKLEIFTPIEGQVSARTEISVQGATDKECHLEANGQEIKVDEKGQFNTTILLADGVNTLTLSTTKKHGKTTTLVRHIVVNDRNAQKVTIKNLGDKAF